MKLRGARVREDESENVGYDLDLKFPEPERPLLEGPGESCIWAECMRETAVQTRYWLENFGHEPPPPAWEERFVLD